MKSLSISTAWEETTAFVKREGHLLFPVALLFLALPGAALEIALPGGMREIRVAGDMKAATPIPPGLIPGILLVGLLALTGALAIYALALRPGISVAEALGLALRRLPVLVGAMLLIGLGFGGAVIIASVIGSIAAMGAGKSAGVALMVALLLPVVLFVSVRLLLLNAVVLNEPAGSIEAIRRGWRLTTGHFARLAGFLAALLLLMLVVQLVSQMLFGLAGIMLGGSALATLFAGLAVAAVNALVQVYFLVMTCRIYRQLAG